jgi:hypothetical protein
MKLRFKEDPREWRKQVLLTALGVAIASSIFRWRKVLSPHVWLAALAFAAVLTVAALLKPEWFRSYYRLSMRIGFFFSKVFGFVALAVFFAFILTPVGLIMRLAGKDTLQLKRQNSVTTFWHPSKDCSPLDRLF